MVTIESRERTTGMGATHGVAVAVGDKWVPLSDLPDAQFNGRENGWYRYSVRRPYGTLYAQFDRSNRGLESVRIYSAGATEQEAIAVALSFEDARRWLEHHTGQGKVYLSSGFSINMLAPDIDYATVMVERCRPEDVPEDAESIIGHQDTAAMVSAILGRDAAFNRVNVAMKAGDVMYVAQYRGPRLPEGATTLPEGAELVWYRITVA